MAESITNNDNFSLSAVYDEDVVQSKDKKKIGIVIKTSRNDDSSDSSDSSESESEDEEKVLPGKVMVGWYSMNSRWNDPNEVTVVDEKQIELVDRSLLHGDVIRWTDKSKGNQKGQILAVDVFVDFKIIGTNHILKNKNSKDLHPLERFGQFLPVVKGAWMGAIQDVQLSLLLVLKNGSKCIVTGQAVNALEDSTDQREEDSTFYCSDFYRGQQVRGPANIFKEAKWVIGSKPAISNHGRIKAVVEEVSVESVDVDWQVCGFSKDAESSLLQPPSIVKKEELDDLKLLNHFKEAHIQIGDKAYYYLTEDDVTSFEKTNKTTKPANEEKAHSSSHDNDISDDEEDDGDYEMDPPSVRPSNTPSAIVNRRGASRPRRKRPAQVHKRKKRYQPPVNFKAGEKVCVEICHTCTFANTQWQDGQEIKNIRSVELHPVIHLDELEFFPGDYVIDKREGSNNIDGFGVIQKADFDARLCTVCWLTLSDNNTTASQTIENDVSVYDIADHKDYAFRAGDIVVRLAAHSDDKPDDEIGNTSPAGEVIKVNLDGRVEVLWTDNTTSSILPSRLYVLNREDDDMDWDDDEDGESNPSQSDQDEWETASDSSDIAAARDLQAQLNPLEDVIMRSLAALNPATGGTTNNSGDHTSDSSIIGRDQRTVDYINALESQFAPSSQHEETPAEIPDTKSHEEQSEEKTVDGSTAQKETENINCIESEPPQPQCSGTQVSFEMTASAPSNHHFLSYPHNGSANRVFTSAVMRDVKLLKSHLPPGITVKCYEDRLDLFSVLIVGPPSTPYQDGLFYFDIQLPEGYPAVPPLVHYYSYCNARLNPNLYEEGKVCVSLLGTWSGKGSETWTSKSTLQQVLLSIQGLILNEEPYYNEAGYESQRGTLEGTENSRLYNEMATIKMLQSIALMISRPPEVFREEVIEHFKTHLPKLIDQFELWLNMSEGVSDSKLIPSYPLFPLSKGFIATVSRVVENLKNKLQVLMET